MPTGRFTRKMLFQPNAVARRPPSAGPAHEARAIAIAIIPRDLPRRSAGTAPRMRAFAEAIIREALKPWRTRLPMRAAMVGESAARSELAVNPMKPATYSLL